MIANMFIRLAPGERNTLALYWIFHILAAMRTWVPVSGAREGRKIDITRAAEIHGESCTIEVFASLKNSRYQDTAPRRCLVDRPRKPDGHRCSKSLVL